jgi:site-specific recombinase XerD
VKHFHEVDAGKPPAYKPNAEIGKVSCLYYARRNYATWMLEQGISPKVVQITLNPSSISVTLDVYSHVSSALERQAPQNSMQHL